MNDSVVYSAQQLWRQLGSFRLSIPGMEVNKGEVIAVIGPTGSGKSTLLRLLAGLDVADRGILTIQGENVSPQGIRHEKMRRMTLVPQAAQLLKGSVRYNVEFGLRLRGPLETDNLVDNVLERLGLAAIVNQHTETLSGGQVQLVALARALVLQPDILLLDEPTAHLDPAHVSRAEEMVREVQKQTGATVIWATHNHFQARRVSDRTALLLDGELIEMAETEQLFSQPADRRTGEFLQGEMVY